LRERLGTGERFILFVGRHEPKKNLVRLVESFHRLKTAERLPHRLVLAGGEGWGCAGLERRIRELGLEGDVVRPGFVPAEDLVRLYNMAELFVFPSLYEGFGLPPLEAMACGTPVVCGNRGALPEVAGGAALCVDPEDTAAIADAMSRALRDGPARERLVAAGLARAAEFTWRRTAAATEAFLREIYARGKGAEA
jgi:glycosyltransferase involved in cell wall biosynthesis